MSGQKIFGLVLNNQPSNGYTPGSTVSGKVILNFSKQQTVNSISMTVIGEAKVSYRHPWICVYSGERIFLKNEITLVEATKGEAIVVPAGRQEYPFSFELPKCIPSTYLVRRGKIDYYIEIAVRKKSGLLGSIKATKSEPLYFRVPDVVDLNERPKNKNPVTITKTRREGTLGEKILKCTFNAAKGGFVPGEMLNFTIDIDNESCTKQINSTTLTFVQKEIVIADHMKPKENYAKSETQSPVENMELKILSTIIGPSVPAGQRQSWVLDDNITIPKVPSTRTDRAHLILVSYAIQIELKPSDGIRPITFSFPIVIGTIPIQDKTSPPLLEMQNLQMDLPPSYEEVMVEKSSKK